MATLDAVTEAFTIDDPQVLRALAHPVRLRILDHFDLAGPQRAADIATALGIPANQASFHLRQLAKYGLVVEAPEAARDGRDRVWRPIANEINVDSTRIADMPGGKAALDVLRTHWAGQAHALIDRIAGSQKQKDTVSAAVNHVVRLTKEDAHELLEELTALVERWRTRDDIPDGARSYELLQLIAPMDRA